MGFFTTDRVVFFEAEDFQGNTYRGKTTVESIFKPTKEKLVRDVESAFYDRKRIRVRKVEILSIMEK